MRKLLIPLLFLLTLVAPAGGQSTGTLLPNVPGQFFDNAGHPCSSCRLYTYSAGTTTLLTTYSDSALTVANPNPIVLDSAGRATIYLSATNYKFVLKTAADATLWTRDNVGAIPSTTVASSFNSICDGRITLTSATPVTTADVAAATTVYFTPYQGNRCALYDGSQWNLTSFSQVSVALGSDTAATNYDLFLYLSAGTIALERVAWSSGTARATALVLQDGVYVKSSDTTRRYLGTYRTTAAAGQTEDSATKRYVWNHRHRLYRPLRVTDPTASWTYTSAAYRQANGATGNKVEVVVGLAEAVLNLRVVSLTSNSGGTNVTTAIGEDSTSAALVATTMAAPSGAQTVLSNATIKYPVIGYHYYAWLEFSAASGTTTWYGDSSVGLIGYIEG